MNKTLCVCWGDTGWRERDYSLHEMLGFLEVNGEAMEASPSLTNCGSASSICFRRSFNFFYDNIETVNNITVA